MDSTNFVTWYEKPRQVKHMRHKISIIGAGNVGSTTAQGCLQKGLGDVVLLDIAEGLAKGKALDLMQMNALYASSSRVTGTADYAETANSDVVVVTAGIVRKPGMSRDDLIATNKEVVSAVVRSVTRFSPNASLIIVTNPLDLMCVAALRASGLPPKKLIGLSGVLDSIRMRYYIAQAARVPAHTVCGPVLGEHGNSMVPLPRLATINGVPAPALLSQKALQEICENTVKGGSTITEMMGTSAYYAPGYSIVVMIEALLNDSKAILPCSVYLEGEYGIRDIFMCVPVRLGKDGAEEIIELPLQSDEAALLAQSAASIRSKLESAALV